VTEVAVVIADYRGAEHLPDCLDSLAAQTQPPSEVIVVDVGSSAESRAVAASRGARVLERANRGLGWAYNEGARATSAEYVLVSNNDVAFDSRCLELLTSALDGDETLFAADPRQLDWTGSRTIHARTTLRRGPLLRTGIPGLVFDGAARPYAGPPVHTAFANAGGMLLRRDRLLELGGFDETFFMDFEDIDLCWRAWLRGWGSVYVPEAVFRHKVGGSTTPAVTPKRLASSHHNLLRFALKCFPAGAAGKVLAAETIRLLRVPRAVGPALGHVLLELPEVMRERRALRPTRELFERLIALSDPPS
jgi:N-acetylglucosaminyl-diphospho-decaprenol L-rhamnosyltransferase